VSSTDPHLGGWCDPCVDDLDGRHRKRIVYIVRSDADPSHHYVGITGDLRSRLDWHNHGPSGHTVRHRPWSVIVAIEFLTERPAVRFEKYLKSGSGRAFAKRHFADTGPVRSSLHSRQMVTVHSEDIGNTLGVNR
jgi:putative endonuclease